MKSRIQESAPYLFQHLILNWQFRNTTKRIRFFSTSKSCYCILGVFSGPQFSKAAPLKLIFPTHAPVSRLSPSSFPPQSPSIYLSIVSHCVFPVDTKYRICVCIPELAPLPLAAHFCMENQELTISFTSLFLLNSALANP